ncbi:DUF3857 domain-containing protein [Erythrobacter sp. LQ02-29]|uniref:DUF3857 domain-containing protein n=1 Tax=Erythrobacter sp. LQ02-29 TaxID=2920384 RepID=UPI001F4EEBDD|nr:DUF3857 domain-containing transglutaminase family protein [Erythrobacter sp. LQ02-29]MCP9222958.1 DUF3857 domain-containing protein [Erythrobacter sp. LQ02-29]
MNRTTYFVAGTVLACVAAPAIAGEEVLYRPAPDWVEVKTLTAKDLADGPPIVNVEQQVRLEGGTVSTYRETALRLNSPEMITSASTLTASWMPDKGDLIIHDVKLIRGDEIVDVIAGGAKFDVLRREAQLERRIVDGARTATLVLPGARVGDVLRFSYSTTQKDQALGENAEFVSPLPTEPVPIADGRLIISWPEGEDVDWMLRGAAGDQAPVARDGYRFLSVPLPLPKPDEMPFDSPLRYRLGAFVEASTFADWMQVSSVMAPHYLDKLSLAADGPIMEQVREIEGKTSDPLERAALATQLVQDRISYMLNGMDGGNYLPQAPDVTWRERYGDCKAKSVLLVAMLRAMDIDAELVLVSTIQGDAIPTLLPTPGNFNHVIAHAVIGGEDYWLDGTTAGTRLANVSAVPAFSYGLPLRAGGADLIELEARVPPVPDATARVTLDSRAGPNLPTLFDIELGLSGAAAGQLRVVNDQMGKEIVDNVANAAVRSYLGNARIVDRSLEFDDETGRGTLRATGVIDSPWSRQEEVYQLEPPGQPAASVSFDADRARAAWRDIPLALGAPTYETVDLKVLLPDGGKGFTIEGEPDIDQTISVVEVDSAAAITGDVFELKQSLRSTGGELAVGDLVGAKRDTAVLQRKLPTIIAPADLALTWTGAKLDPARMKPLEDAFAKIIAKADERELAGAYYGRAALRSSVYDYAGAREDLTKAIEAEASADMYSERAGLAYRMGDFEASLADYQQAEALNADGSTYWSQVDLLGLLGRPEEGLTLAEDYADIAEKNSDARSLMASALMWNGQIEEGLSILASEVKKRPGDPTLLNSECWQGGIWNAADASLLSVCDQAVAKSDWSADKLDSRAMVHFRLGEMEEALTDLDAVLASAPELAQSMFLRGIVRLRMGDKGGRKDIELAQRIQPSVARINKAYGIEP